MRMLEEKDIPVIPEVLQGLRDYLKDKKAIDLWSIKNDLSHYDLVHVIKAIVKLEGLGEIKKYYGVVMKDESTAIVETLEEVCKIAEEGRYKTDMVVYKNLIYKV